MSRPIVVAGNWKMNLSLEEAVELTTSIERPASDNVRVMIFPSYVYLNRLLDIVASTNSIVEVGAQNCHEAEKGAFTGEISPGMLNSIGLTSVIIGHSERRQIYGESNELLKRKVDAALSSELTVVFCIGETLEEREAGKEFDVVRTQLEDSLFHLNADQMENVIIAYEPVWAIGTGKTASPEQAQEIHAYIRSELKAKYGSLSEDLIILYGGSVKPSNAKELFSKTDVDGGLIGGASLKPDDFNAIIRASSELV